MPTRRLSNARPHRAVALAIGVALAAVPSAFGQTTSLNASALALRSTGSLVGSDVTLSSNGYVGTYVTLAAPGQVTLSVSAAGVADAGVAPRLGIVVNDARATFNVAPGFNAYQTTLNLPAGTHFVRTQYDNDLGSASRSLTVRSLGVTGATVANLHNDATALAAADTYVANYRKGNAAVALTGPGGIPLLAGQTVSADLSRHAFNFGTAVPGTSTSGVNSYFGTGTTKQAQYQARLRQNFNAVVPENAGKWAYNESTRDTNTMAAVDQILSFAQSNGMRTRMHNLIWGDNSNNGQQPPWVLNSNAAPNNGLLDKAWLGDAAAKAELRTEITERIAYYVGTGLSTDRAKRYVELDIYNESYHTGSNAPSSPTDLRANYWNVYGPTGVADIYRETIAAINASGATAKVFVNEYNVLDDANYGNYYARHIEAIRDAGRAAGYGDVVQGIGAQYYPSTGTHAARKVLANLQNFGVQGLPVSLTEYGAQSSLTTAQGASILGEMLRLTFGNADSTGFFMWGFHQETFSGGTTLFAPQSALYTVPNSDFGTWTLTDAGKVWQDLLGIADHDGNPNNAWTTRVTPVVAADGSISFNGFFGDYALGGQAGALALVKGTSAYAVQLVAPPTWAFWKPSNSGTWGTASNWSNALPAGLGWTAHFPASIAPRTVTLSADVVVGQLNFEGTGSYTLNGDGRITLDGAAGLVALNVTAGSHRIENELTSGDALLARIASGATLELTSTLMAGSITKTGPGTLRAASVTTSAVSIEQGTLRTTGGPSVVGSLAIAPGATLDIDDAVWIVDYPAAGPSPAAGIEAMIASGTGIVSTYANGSARRGIGWAEAWTLPTAPIEGATLDGSAVVLRATLLGDADLDLDVDFADLLALAQHYGQPGATWAYGDFDYDDAVDFADLLNMAQNYGTPIAGSFAADWAMARSLVPEPTIACVALAFTSALQRRRCRAAIPMRQ